MFDYKKLEQYKVALDDGFGYKKQEHDGNVGTGYLEILIFKSDDLYYRLYETYNEDIEFMIAEKDWEEFKNKVENFFLGGK